MELATLIDLTARAIKHPRDYLTAFNTHVLRFENMVQESDSVYSFFFTPKKKFAWQSGQHGVFTLMSPGAKSDPKRIFSISSSITESVIQFSTIIQDKPSLFKKQLLELKPGEEVHMQGPIGEFHLPQKSAHIVGVAGGIGITPFRAMIKELIDTNRADVTIDLLYGCTAGTKTFAEELATWSQKPYIHVTYPNGAEELQQKLKELSRSVGNHAHYYLSGSPRMIDELRLVLKQQKITTIINDPFKGYT